MSVEHDWDEQRQRLLGHKISDLGLSIAGSRVERLVQQLHDELDSRGVRFKPPVYLSDQWGCPDGTPLIGVPFYLADPRLERIEAEMSFGIEDDADAMRYLRHEAGHAFNYAFQLYDRPAWQMVFGSFNQPYRDRYRANPLSRDHVRHILTWYAQKHPDEDFAETFAVWLTPGSNWREEYAGWPALRKLEYVDEAMREVANLTPYVPEPADDDLPVTAMRYTVAEHYHDAAESIPLEDDRQFDVDLRQIFMRSAEAPDGELAADFLRRHRREIVSRVAFWTSEQPSVVQSLVDVLARRAEALSLRAGTLEASTLIELTSFATAVVMLFRYTHVFGRARRATLERVG
ncbi:MAG TPA: putative zinc-binding metallopeptidase [Gemmatimonadaceae bacterium]|nr:putative zinc-binding metallopeptidase [Gemmatimonadaceae bacterium]